MEAKIIIPKNTSIKLVTEDGEKRTTQSCNLSENLEVEISLAKVITLLLEEARKKRPEIKEAKFDPEIESSKKRAILDIFLSFL